jgi:lipopolysaccharide transport system permease protein
MNATPVRIIAPGRAEAHYWRDLWRYRELLWILAWRDVAVRYKQTLIGVAWAGLRPLLVMVIFTLVFGSLAKLPSDGRVPYALLVLTGMLPWYLCSSAVTGAAESLVANANLIAKVYFPRIILPMATIGTALVDFAISFVLLVAMMLWYGIAPGWQIVCLPFFVVLALATSLGLGLWITALNLKYRDVRFVVPFAAQVGLYVSPVGFSGAVIPERWRLVYSLNPVAGIIDGFRWSLLGGESAPYWPGVLLSLLVTAGLCWLGVTRFRRTERAFADLI